jgi:ATP/maltotriose-dependent transcriptional regulator MalT
MPGPLLETKLYVRRPRLSERLNRGAESKLTLVLAPAGFGKTTLLAEWLAAAQANERSAVWLSLDPRDNHPATFWTYLITALQTVAPGVGAGALALLESPQPPPVETVITTLLNEVGGIAEDVVLVLDDYHLIDARDVQDSVVFLLDHLPPRLHLVIASRADPALPLARLRPRGELVEVRAADLRFTLDEAAAYLNDVLGARLLDEQPNRVPDLHRRASAWHERNGEPSEAIRHALAAEDFPKAADLVRSAVSRTLAWCWTSWAAWFDGLSLTHADDGTTVIHGPVVDQTALHGLLSKVRDLGLPLIAVTQVNRTSPNT